MKKTTGLLLIILCFFMCTAEDCDGRPENKTAKDEQALTELNQRGLL